MRSDDSDAQDEYVEDFQAKEVDSENEMLLNEKVPLAVH